MMATQGRSRTFRILTSLLVSLAAGFRVFTRGALRDDVKNGCEGDYPLSYYYTTTPTGQNSGKRNILVPKLTDRFLNRYILKGDPSIFLTINVNPA